jgi:hypothetical protein
MGTADYIRGEQQLADDRCDCGRSEDCPEEEHAGISKRFVSLYSALLDVLLQAEVVLGTASTASACAEGIAGSCMITTQIGQCKPLIVRSVTSHSAASFSRSLAEANFER